MSVPTLRLEYRHPQELSENPDNWRLHPQSQIDALTDVISEVGWAGACLFNERTGRLIDGHARKKTAIAKNVDRIPVLIGNWSEEQERKILATLDPLAAMAEADSGQIAALLQSVATESLAITAMLDHLAAESGLRTLSEISTPPAGTPNPSTSTDPPSRSADPHQFIISAVVDAQTYRRWQKFKDSTGYTLDTPAFRILLDAVKC